MKKLLISLALVTLCVLSFTGCGETSAPSDTPTTIALQATLSLDSIIEDGDKAGYVFGGMPNADRFVVTEHIKTVQGRGDYAKEFFVSTKVGTVFKFRNMEATYVVVSSDYSNNTVTIKKM